MQLRQTLILLLVTSFGVPAFAQNAPDLVGLWSLEKEESADSRCGASTHVARLDVTKKITGRAYRGRASELRSTADCGVKSLGETSFTLRIRDRAVSIEYDDEAWPPQTFLLDGNVLVGSDEGGAPVEFVRTEAKTAPAAEIDFGRLDEMLGEMRPELYEQLGNEYGTRMLRNLRRTGLDSKQARQVAEETIWRMADCVIAMVREDLVAMSLPLDELLNDRRATMLLNPKQLDYRKYECIHDTAMNAGVIIK
jgi:hypothetical protein